MFTPIGRQRFADDPSAFEDTFRHQFVLREDASADLPGWRHVGAAGWHLFHAPDLPVAVIEDAAGLPVAWVLGVAVDAVAAPVRDGYRLDVSLSDPNFATQTESFVEGCAGRYVCAVLTDRARRLYLDPIGDLAAVYHPESRTVGSTNAVVMERDFIDNPRIPYARVRTGEVAYTMGHTRDAEVKRLLGGHYLELDSFTPKRHWPKSQTDIETRTDPQEVHAIADTIGERLGDVFRSLLCNETCIFPLSGGRDSRCLLGVGLPDIHRAAFIFSWNFHRQSRRDTKAAQEICRTLGLDHRAFGNQALDRQMRMKFLLRTGYSVFGTVFESLAISESLPGGHLHVRGNVMGLLRAVNWYRQREGHLDLGHALKRLRSGFAGNERMSVFADDFMAYYQTLPQLAQAKVYDFLWLEIVLTHGQGARAYGTPQNFYINPFNDRRLLQLSVQLPVPYRMADAAYDRIVETTLPSLAHIGYI